MSNDYLNDRNTLHYLRDERFIEEENKKEPNAETQKHIHI